MEGEKELADGFVVRMLSPSYFLGVLLLKQLVIPLNARSKYDSLKQLCIVYCTITWTDDVRGIGVGL